MTRAAGAIAAVAAAVGLLTVPQMAGAAAPATPRARPAVTAAPAAMGRPAMTARTVTPTTPKGAIGPRGGTIRTIIPTPAAPRRPPPGLATARPGFRTTKPYPATPKVKTAPGVIKPLPGGGAAKSFGTGGFKPIRTSADPLAVLAFPDGAANSVAARAMESTVGKLPGMRVMRPRTELPALRACGAAAAEKAAAPAASASATPDDDGDGDDAEDEDPQQALIDCLTGVPLTGVDYVIWLEVKPSRQGRVQTVSAMLIEYPGGGIVRWAEASERIEISGDGEGAAAPGKPDAEAVNAAIGTAATDAAEQLGGEFSPMDVLDSLPILLMLFIALLVLVSDAFVRTPGPCRYALYITLAGLAGTLGLVYAHWSYLGAPAARSLFGGFANGGPMMVLDRFSLFFDLIFVLAAGLGALLTYGYHRIHGGDRGERYALILLSAVGMMIMSAGTDLLTVFLGLETMSLSVYVMVGSNRARKESAEAGVKYFLMGAVASAILLYGIALTYGATGTTRIALIAQVIQERGLTDAPLMLAGMFLVIGGFAFKIAAVPFHAWVPDVYQGAPSPVTGYMSVAVKAAAFAAFGRVLMGAFPALDGIARGAVEAGAAAPGWYAAILPLTWLTLILGNTAAIPQNNVKRMLAYSGIAHAGYVLIGVCTLVSVAQPKATAAILYYLLAYTVTNLGAFAVLIAVGRRGDEKLSIDSYAGLARKRPAIALAMVVCLASLAGIPPTAGFFAKFYLFMAAVDANLVSLAVLGVVTSLAGMYYYLRVVVYMYMRAPPKQSLAEGEPQANTAVYLAIALTVIGILLLGILPGSVLELASSGVAALAGL